MSQFRRSAAVLVAREGASGQAEVYLVKRNDRLRFFGGYWALPGGVLLGDKSDKPELFTHCAARELLEETGLLLEDWRTSFGDIEALRRDLIGDENADSWHRIASQQGTPISLIPLGAMRTPAFAPVRYHTEFYAYWAEREDQLHVIPGELSAGEFVDPKVALQEWKHGERLIVPPVRTKLEMFAELGWQGFCEQAPARLAEYLAGRMPPIMNSPGVCMLPLRTPTIPPATTTNHYLVGESRMYLVDPGTPYADEQERLMRFVQDRISAGCALEGILLTHQHWDHVGGLRAVEERFDVPVLAHAHTHASLKTPALRPIEIHDGQRLPLGEAPDGSADWHLETIATPGHAAGHFVFQDSRYGVVIGGDLASTVSTIVIEPPEGHLATYLASLQRIIDRKPTLFYPAHGPVARDGVALLKGYIKHRADREDQLVEALRRSAAQATSSMDLVPLVYPELDPAIYGLAELSLVAGLIKLREEGRAHSSSAGWQLV